MASYYRNVFLEFLINNRSSQIDVMTFVIFDKNDEDGWIENKDLISLFHIKEPRTYYKELSFNDLYNTIVEDFLELRTTEVLEVGKINKIYLDPYNKKAIFEFNFTHLIIVPVIKNEELKALCFIYATLKDNKCLINDKKIEKLYDELQKEEIQSLKNEVYDYTSKQPYSLWVVFNKNSKAILFSNYQPTEINKDELHQFTKEQYLNILYQLGYHIAASDDTYDGLMFFDRDLNNDNLMLSSNEIKKHRHDGVFTIIHVKYAGYEEYSFDQIYELFNNLYCKFIENFEYKFYKVSENSFVCIINDKFDKRILQKMSTSSSKLKITYVRSGADISSKADLGMLVEFLEINEESEFRQEYYLFYRQKKNEYAYKIALVKDNAKLVSHLMVWNSVNKEIDGKYIVNDAFILNNNNMTELQFTSTSKCINEVLSNDYEKIYLLFDAKTLLKRQMWEYIKKVVRKYNINFNLILITNDINENELSKIITKLNNLEISYFLDSQIFMTFEKEHMLENAKGIFVRNEEVNNLIRGGETCGKEVIKYYLNHNYMVLFEADNNSVGLFEHKNLFMITK
jgi:hypothetical protein